MIGTKLDMWARVAALGGGGGVISIPPPSGFGATPFNAAFLKNGSIYSTSFDPPNPLVEGGPGVSTYYVDKAAGLDTNPGTQAQPYKTLYKAVIANGRSTAPKMLLKVKGGQYFYTETFNEKNPEATTFSVVSWDGLPIICTNELRSLSWTLDITSTYYASVLGQGGYPDYGSTAWDALYPDAWGDHKPLIPAASVVACRATTGTYYTDQPSGRIYVHCEDNRAPDANIHVFDAFGTPGQYRDYGGSPASGILYMENVVFLGGAVPFYLQQTHATNTTNAVFKNCVFKYARLNEVFKVEGNVDVASINSIVANGYGDCFGYQSYGANPSPRALEINCEVRRSGCTLPVSIANQGSTTHNGSKIVRLNGNYHHNQNDQITDVDAGSLTWMMGCTAANGLQAGFAAYRCGNGGGNPKMWLDGCVSSGQTFDIFSDAGASVLTRNFTGGAINGGTGSIGTY